MSDLVVKLDQHAVDALARRGGVAAEEVRAHAERSVNAARAAAPVRSGRLREGVVLREGEDDRGYYADVATTVVNRYGFAYGALQEARQPYIRPSVS